MKANRVERLRHMVNDPALPDPQPGDFEIVNGPEGEPARFDLHCPGCDSLVVLPLVRATPTSRAGIWTLSGTLDAPTLDKEIEHFHCWRGYLREGVFMGAKYSPEASDAGPF